MNHFIHLTPDSDKKLRFDVMGEYVVFFNGVSGEIEVELGASGVRVYIFGLYTGKENTKYSLRTLQHHTAPDTWSDLLIKGVFDDRSSLDYAGLIRIEKNCNGSHAYQKNQNIMVSKHAQVRSEPKLEILSNDVFCTHGSTTGTMNKDMLYYMQTRGLTHPQAQALYVEGFLEDLYVKVREHAPEFREA